MKFLTTADWHIGLTDEEWRDDKTLKIIYNRSSEQLNNFRQMAEYCYDNNIFKIIVAGDVFHTSKPSSQDLVLFFLMVEIADRYDIELIIINGNHDISISEDILSAIHTANLKNVKIIGYTRAEQYDNINFIFIPFSKGIDYKLEINDCLEKNKDFFNIPVIHDEYKGAVTGSEQFVMRGGVNFIDDIPKVDLVIAGHIHKQQLIRGKSDVLYSGSLTTINFGEEKDTKGFIEIDSSGYKLKYTFHSFKNLMKWKTIKIDMKTGFKFSDLKIKEKKFLAKLQIVISKQKRKSFNVEDFKDKFEKKFNCKVLKYEFSITGKDFKIKKLQKNLSPVELFEKYLIEKKYKEPEIKTLAKELNNIIGEIE